MTLLTQQDLTSLLDLLKALDSNVDIRGAEITLPARKAWSDSSENRIKFFSFPKEVGVRRVPSPDHNGSDWAVDVVDPTEGHHPSD